MYVYVVLATHRFVEVDSVHSNKKAADSRAKILQDEDGDAYEVNVFKKKLEGWINPLTEKVASLEDSLQCAIDVARMENSKRR